MSVRAIARVLLVLLLGVAAPAVAQDVQQIAAAAKSLNDDGRELQAIDASLNGRIDASERQDLRQRALAVKKQAADAVDQLTVQEALIDAKLTQLGAATPGIVEAPDIRAQRTALSKQRSALDSGIKRGRLLGVDADQLIGDINESQADALTKQIAQRSLSPVSPAFWTTVARFMPRDSRRVRLFVVGEASVSSRSVAGGGFWPALIGAVVALGLIFPVRLSLKRLGRGYAVKRVPGSRIRRSALALWLVVVGTLVPALAAMALVQGLRWAQMLSAEGDAIGTGFVFAAAISAFITSLGSALLMRSQPSWRLLPLDDEAAAALRPWTWAIAALAFVSILLSRFNGVVGASAPARDAADFGLALLHLLVLAGLLVALGRVGRSGDEDDDTEAEQHPGQQTALGLIALIGSLITIGAFVALLLGYLGLALLAARSTIWIAVVASALYLALVAADDLCTGLLNHQSRFGHSLHKSLRLRNSAIDQAGVLLSALLRLVLITLAISIAFGPFGSNIDTLFDQIGRIAQGVTIGQVTISPGAILRAILVLAIGLLLVRGAQHWLTRRYLPTTELDGGARNSISMVARYTGVMVVAIWALASLGIGIERIALLLSALSVGIGFGLQAITQNFVSGLILLAERPVKIGDLVRIGDQEGDVKRISVRSTEILIGDNSTLIVPNSELITKTIRNLTLSNPVGRFQLQFSIQIGADVARTREIVLGLFNEVPAVRDAPAPSVFIDSIADGRINFNCFAYVASPREAYGTRSTILFELLQRLPAAGIELGTARQQLELIGSSPLAPPAGAPATRDARREDANEQ